MPRQSLERRRIRSERRCRRTTFAVEIICHQLIKRDAEFRLKCLISYTIHNAACRDIGWRLYCLMPMLDACFLAPPRRHDNFDIQHSPCFIGHFAYMHDFSPPLAAGKRCYEQLPVSLRHVPPIYYYGAMHRRYRGLLAIPKESVTC